MEAIYEELRKAKEALDAAKREHADALRQVEDEKKKSSKAEERPPTYGAREYWDERYRGEMESGEGSEWYMPFSNYGKLLGEEMNKTRKTPTQALRVLIPGCGDSRLAEDIVASVKGIEEVVAVDFSETVVKQMQQRNHLLAPSYQCIHYKMGNVLDLRSQCESGTIDVVVDKGTLDCIAASSTPWTVPNRRTPLSPEEAVVTYMRELWRSLRMHGRCIIITTMNPHVFQSLAIDPALHSFVAHQDSFVPRAISNYNQGHLHKTFRSHRHPDTESVNFFVLVKTGDYMSRDDLVKQSIVQFVQTAKEALEDEALMGEASGWTEEEDLSAGGKTQSKSLPSLLPPTEHLLAPPNSSADQPAAYITVVPRSDGDTIRCDDVVEVRIVMLGETSEDDVVRLVLADRSLHSGVTSGIVAVSEVRSMYPKHEVNRFEQFEYVDDKLRSVGTAVALLQSTEAESGLSPQEKAWLQQYVSTDASMGDRVVQKGTLSMKMPDVSSYLRFHYLRRVNPDAIKSTDGENAVAVRAGDSCYEVLGGSDTITLAGPLHHSTAPYTQQQQNQWQLKGRRSAATVITPLEDADGWTMRCELLSQTRRLQLRLNPPSNCPISRVQAWVITAPCSSTEYQVTVVLEYDRIIRSADADTVHIRTESVSVMLPQLLANPVQIGDLILHPTYLMMSIRLNMPIAMTPPGSCQPILMSPASSTADLVCPSSSYLPTPSDLSDRVACQFCHNSLLQSDVREVRAQADGLLDEHRSSLLCVCEDKRQESWTQTGEDMVVPRDSALCGDLCVLLSPQNLRASALLLTPVSAAQTCHYLNLLSPLSSALLTQELDRDRRSNSNSKNSGSAGGPLMAWSRIQRAEVCSVQCARCFSCIGDALLDLSLLDNEHDDDSNVDGGDDVLTSDRLLSSARQVRLCWHLLSAPASESSTTAVMTLAARLCRTMMARHSVPLLTFVLLNPASSSTASSSGEAAVHEEVRLKVLSLHSLICISTSKKQWQRCVKVAVIPTSGSVERSGVGKEVRIPLSLEEFFSLREGLTAAASQWREFFEDVIAVTGESFCFLPL